MFKLRLIKPSTLWTPERKHKRPCHVKYSRGITGIYTTCKLNLPRHLLWYINGKHAHRILVPRFNRNYIYMYACALLAYFAWIYHFERKSDKFAGEITVIRCFTSDNLNRLMGEHHTLPCLKRTRWLINRWHDGPFGLFFFLRNLPLFWVIFPSPNPRISRQSSIWFVCSTYIKNVFLCLCFFFILSLYTIPTYAIICHHTWTTRSAYHFGCEPSNQHKTSRGPTSSTTTQPAESLLYLFRCHIFNMMGMKRKNLNAMWSLSGVCICFLQIKYLRNIVCIAYDLQQLLSNHSNAHSRSRTYRAVGFPVVPFVESDLVYWYHIIYIYHIYDVFSLWWFHEGFCATKTKCANECGIPSQSHDEWVGE